MTKPPQKRLGRGLSSLISADIGRAVDPEGLPPSSPTAEPNETALIHPVQSPSSVAGTPRLQSIPVAAVRQNPRQPRKEFDEAALVALSQSLRERGALQPIVVRPAEGGYELVAGERRLRAAKLAGLTEIPAVIRAVADDQMLELALIENVQRQDLNPVERARAYRQLHQTYGLSHEQIAAKMGEDRATVTNYLRMLALPDKVLEYLARNEITAGHAKALLSVASPADQLSIADRIIQEGWSVRRTEAESGKLQLAASLDKPAAEPSIKRATVRDMEDSLNRALGLRVIIKEGRKSHTGKVTIEYYNLNDFERLASLLGARADRP